MLSMDTWKRVHVTQLSNNRFSFDSFKKKIIALLPSKLYRRVPIVRENWEVPEIFFLSFQRENEGESFYFPRLSSMLIWGENLFRIRKLVRSWIRYSCNSLIKVLILIFERIYLIFWLLRKLQYPRQCPTKINKHNFQYAIIKLLKISLSESITQQATHGFYFLYYFGKPLAKT